MGTHSHLIPRHRNGRLTPASRRQPLEPHRFRQASVRRSHVVGSSSSVSRSPRERPSKYETPSHPRSWNGGHHGGQQAQTSTSGRRRGRRPGFEPGGTRRLIGNRQGFRWCGNRTWSGWGAAPIRLSASVGQRIPGSGIECPGTESGTGARHAGKMPKGIVISTEPVADIQSAKLPASAILLSLWEEGQLFHVGSARCSCGEPVRVTPSRRTSRHSINPACH